MAGTLEATDAWFRTPSSQVSAHYGVGLDGAIHAYVRTWDRAWANGILEPGNCWGDGWPANPNDWTVSVETEDLGHSDQVVTPEQYDSVRTLCRTVIARHGCTWLAGHSMITPRSRPNCPGSRWVESGELSQLASDCGLDLLC
jgi:N-acetyl-anhydromuramyl-L-alanine amidase AmpD